MLDSAVRMRSVRETSPQKRRKTSHEFARFDNLSSPRMADSRTTTVRLKVALRHVRVRAEPQPAGWGVPRYVIGSRDVISDVTI